MSTDASPVRRRRRAALAAVLALVTVPLMTSSAEAAPKPKPCPDPAVPCVSVMVITTAKGVDTEVVSYTIDIGPDTVDVTDPAKLKYTSRAKVGGTVKKITGIQQALSIKKILGSGEFDETSARFSETPNESKIPSVLRADYLSGSYKFANGLVPAVYATSDGIGYVRPLRKAENDVNAGDIFRTGKRLVLTIHTSGDLLDVDIKASPKKITTKTPVSFSADISPKSDGLSYRWNLTGGTKVEDKTATPSITYKKKDSYAVNLEVFGDDGSYGRASTTTVKVGNPPKPKPTPTATTGTGGGSGTGGGGSGYIPPFVPNTPDVPSDDAPAEDPIEDLPTTPVDDGLEEVEGFVLAGAGSEMGESIPGTDAAAQPTEANELSTKRKISGAAIGALAVLLLLGLGAEIETRWLSTRLGHLRRRA